MGYTVNSSGELNYSSLVLNNMKGPFIVEDSSWSSALPFTSGAAKVYKNGSASTISGVSKYDVYYYNKSMMTVWVYRNQVSGVYSAATPSTSAPSSVTVAGKTYAVSTSSASYALSDLGSFGFGDTVTLLLGMNGDIVGVVSASDVSSTKYGFVISTDTKTYTGSSGNSYSSNTITVTCTDGGSYEYECSLGYSKGNMVQISVSGGKTTVTGLSNRSLSGTVNSAATAFGSYAFSDDVQILDSSEHGSCIRVYPSRLAGLSLSSDNVRYYVLDASGKISHLILNDVTGEMYKYGILTRSSESYDSMNISALYSYIIDGISGSYNSDSMAFGVSSGPVQMEFSGSTIVKLKNLTGMALSSISSSYAESNGVQYMLGDNVSVYICKNGSYYLSSISAVSNTSSYSLYGYYDKSISVGGRIRIIIANEHLT